MTKWETITMIMTTISRLRNSLLPEKPEPFGYYKEQLCHFSLLVDYYPPWRYTVKHSGWIAEGIVYRQQIHESSTRSLTTTKTKCPKVHEIPNPPGGPQKLFATDTQEKKNRFRYQVNRNLLEEPEIQIIAEEDQEDQDHEEGNIEMNN